MMLYIVMLANTGGEAKGLQISGTMTERRQHPFDAFIVTIFARRGQEAHYTEQQTNHWLFWLAVLAVPEQRCCGS
jgi:hypothetical protein